MWQRIQSVFLGLVILSLFASLFMPVWEGIHGPDIYRVYPIYLMHKFPEGDGTAITSLYFPYALTSLLIVAAITIAIQEFRRFDNRMLQIKLGTLNALILVGVMVAMVLLSNDFIKTNPDVPGRYDLSLYLCFVAVISNWLAMRFIRRDEKIVRDADRLR